MTKTFLELVLNGILNIWSKTLLSARLLLSKGIFQSKELLGKGQPAAVWDLLKCENSLASSWIKSEIWGASIKKRSSGFWLWIVFLLLRILVLHFSEFILPALLHCCCLGIKYFLSEMSHMACHLLPQPWSTPKCVVYLDSSCDLSVNWNIGCTHSGLFCAYCILEISLSSLEAVQQLLLGNVHLSLSAPDSCAEPGSNGMMNISPFGVFSVGGTGSICASTSEESIVFYVSVIQLRF